jgi:peptidoglycan hydrolase-like protein with peptidoglycan-binding domain
MKGLIPKCWSALPPQPSPTPTPTPTPSKKGYSGTFPKPTLKKGSKGKEVKNLQRFLNWYNGKRVLDVDGVFLKYTDAAVRRFQKAEGLVVDGIVGIKTVNKMHGIKK